MNRQRVSRKTDDFRWFQFYVPDWLSGDNGLKACSFAAKGLWIDMLCHMFLSTRRGVLTGDVQMLSDIVGRSREIVEPLLAELEAKRVFSRGADVHSALDEDAIVSRRMFRQWSLGLIRADAGRKGGRASAQKRAEANLDGAPSNETGTNGNSDKDLGDSSSSKKPATLFLESEAIGQKQIDQPNLGNPVVSGSTRAREGLVSADSLLPTILESLVPKPSGIPEAELLTRRIMAATGDGPAYRAWWRSVLDVFAQSGGLSSVEGHVQYVEDCANAVTRKLKDLGELQKPGAYLASKVLAEARARKLMVPGQPSAKPVTRTRRAS